MSLLTATQYNLMVCQQVNMLFQKGMIKSTLNIKIISDQYDYIATSLIQLYQSLVKIVGSNVTISISRVPPIEVG